MLAIDLQGILGKVDGRMTSVFKVSARLSMFAQTTAHQVHQLHSIIPLGAECSKPILSQDYQLNLALAPRVRRGRIFGQDQLVVLHCFYIDIPSTPLHT